MCRAENEVSTFNILERETARNTVRRIQNIN